MDTPIGMATIRITGTIFVKFRRDPLPNTDLPALTSLRMKPMHINRTDGI